MGAGLLANAMCQPLKMLNVKPHSKASSLPQWISISTTENIKKWPPRKRGHFFSRRINGRTRQSRSTCPGLSCTRHWRGFR
ncbi:hypothetical protein EVS84_11095 [Pseudomonas koreensis]|uniref:Uncharacterized protein n=1 Tax=Pseudomonas koreensis TaxID=198620 RepID=A0A4Q4L3X5_9PSED|nr:hypothetical protein EVS84_11095 [Pseudomonas koreensis]